jgi:holo-[acyl-carrier protein] synthase
MIVGIGMDILEISRIARILDKPMADRFLRRILTPAELDLAGKKQARLAEFAAGRFAAKEAVAKALGTGIGTCVGFEDIEVMPDQQGRPVCTVSEAAWRRIGHDPICMKIHVTITHSEHTAAAFAVLEQV